MRNYLLAIILPALLLYVFGVSCGTAAKEPVARLWVQDTLTIGPGDCSCLEFSPDGKYLASVGGRGPSVRIWDVVARKIVADLRPHACYCVAFSRDGKTLASCGDRRILLWEVATWKHIGSLRTDVPVYGVVFSSDGKKLTAIEKWGLSVWDPQTKESLRDHEIKPRPFRVSAYSLVKRPLVAVRGIRGRDGIAPVTLMDAVTGEEVLTCGWHKGGVSCVAMDRAETMVATMGGDQTVRLWDRRTGEHTATFENPADSVCLAFSPDSRILACGFVHGPASAPGGEVDRIRLYQIPSGKLLAEEEEHGTGVTALAFSPDGRLFASGGRDGRIILWTTPAAWRKNKK